MKNLFLFLCAAGFASGTFSPETQADTSAAANTPALRVKIVAPLNGSIFPLGAEIHIAAQAEVTQGFVKTVEFFTEGKSLGLAINNPLSASPVNPFYVTWKDAPPGEHVLTAKATDDAGRIALSEPIRIHVLSSADAT